MISVKKLIEERYVIICDTNVFLNIYNYSPEFSEFALMCLTNIKNELIIPYIVNLEYQRKYKELYRIAKKKIQQINVTLNSTLKKFKSEFDKQIDILVRYNYPDMDNLSLNIHESIDKIKLSIDDYYNNHEILSSINDKYLETDYILSFIDKLKDNILEPPTVLDLYNICEEGKKRYNKNTPPGFEDKVKDGINKYNDLIIWKEILSFAKSNKVNVLFITDDLKKDWWNSAEDKLIEFHHELFEEFKKKTKQNIIAIQSAELYSSIAEDYDVKKSELIDVALKQTEYKYINSIEMDIIECIENEISLSPENHFPGLFFDETGLEEVEVIDHQLINLEQQERNLEGIKYKLIYDVDIIAKSREYLGRDDETKEIIYSPENKHFFSLNVTVFITRNIDEFIDYEFDTDYDDIEIRNVEVKKHECYRWNEQENGELSCPQCGEKITFENDSLNGFCRQCTIDYDK